MSSTSRGTYTAFSPSCCSAALWMAGLRLQRARQGCGGSEEACSSGQRAGSPEQAIAVRGTCACCSAVPLEASLLHTLSLSRAPAQGGGSPMADRVAHNAKHRRVAPLLLQPVHAAQLLQRWLARRCGTGRVGGGAWSGLAWAWAGGPAGLRLWPLLCEVPASCLVQHSPRTPLLLHHLQGCCCCCCRSFGDPDELGSNRPSCSAAGKPQCCQRGVCTQATGPHQRARHPAGPHPTLAPATAPQR